MQRFGFNYTTTTPYNGVVEVELENGIKGGAQCNFEAGDKFDYRFGQELALRRALTEHYGIEIAALERQVKIMWNDRIQMEGTLAAKA